MKRFDFLKQINDVWFDKTVPYPVPDPNNLMGHCVQFIRWILIHYMDLPNWCSVVGAKDFWERYKTDPNMNEHWERFENTPDFLPKKGDICIWGSGKGGGYGHIAMVCGDCTLNYFTSIESNWKPFKVSVVQHNYNDVIGFLRLKGNVHV